VAPTARTRPARALAIIFLALFALYAVVFTNHWTPRLGLDLRGGTSITLTPRGNVSGGNLDKAVDIIRQRVNGSGVAEAEVVRQGNNVLVAIPNVGREEALKVVGKTAFLSFRHVAASSLPISGTGLTSPSASASPTTSGSATPAATTSSASPGPATSTTSAGRALAEALLRARRALTPTPTPAKTGAARATGTAKPAPAPSATSPTPPTQEQLYAQVPAALRKHAEALDCTEPDKVQPDPKLDVDPLKPIVACDRQGGGKLLLDPATVPGVKNPKNPGDVLTGRDVTSAQATTLNTTGEWIVLIHFNGKGTKKFAAVTKAYLNQQVAISLDNLVQSAPTIQSEISDGTAQISGSFTKKTATDLANVVKYGALPVVFDTSEIKEISPTLGQESLNKGLLAGVLGLGIVVLYSLLYYRGLGLVTVLGLLLFSAMNFALVIILGHLIGFTLTLAGIAGLIVSVGITADSYVVFYERLKDEAREGRSLRSSVERGFARAWRTIITADVVSFLAAGTLYYFSIGAVRGFAFTLGLSTLLDVTIAWLFTRPLVILLSRTRLFSEGRFVGIKAATGGDLVVAGRGRSAGRAAAKGA
jgi:preprotein translocase subunit SecD